MSFSHKLRLLPVASLLLSLVTAQICYYPDGLTVSNDTPCNTNAEASSCCPSGSFCMGNGLCYNAGITSRGSCTDQDWNSDECASYCRTTSMSASVSLTPCDAATNTFACGLNNTLCRNDDNTFAISSGTSFVLSTSQVDALVANSTSSNETKGKTYSASAMTGLGLGIGLPLSFALMLALLVLRKEKQKNNGPKLMYRPAEENGVQLSTIHMKNSSALSRNDTTSTMQSTYKPPQARTFSQRYEHYKNPFASEADPAVPGVPIYEIGSSSPPYSEQERVEAPEKRFSK